MVTHEVPQIESHVRECVGSRDTIKVRRSGRLPAVIYGHKQDPVHVTLDQGQITELLHHNAHMVEVAVGGKTESCLIKDVQWNHLGSKILHIDLARVDLTERVAVEVELELVGEAIGLKESGAYLDHPIDMLSIECLASQIPESIRVDVSELKVGDSITIEDLKLPDGVTTMDSPETLIAMIHIAEGEDETTEGEVAPAEVQPELIRKKEDDEG